MSGAGLGVAGPSGLTGDEDAMKKQRVSDARRGFPGMSWPTQCISVESFQQTTSSFSTVPEKHPWLRSVVVCVLQGDLTPPVLLFLSPHASKKKVKRLVAQSCPTPCDPVDCSPQVSSVHGILQARILEWVAMPSSRRSSQPRDQTQVSSIADGFFTMWATREGQYIHIYSPECIYVFFPVMAYPRP